MQYSWQVGWAMTWPFHGLSHLIDGSKGDRNSFRHEKPTNQQNK